MNPAKRKVKYNIIWTLSADSCESFSLRAVTLKPSFSMEDKQTKTLQKAIELNDYGNHNCKLQ